MKNLILDNFFTAKLTSSISNSLDDGTFTIDNIPSGDWGYVIVNYGKTNQEIIPFYANDNGTLSYRGIERTDIQSHNIGEIVYINNVAQIFNYMNEYVGSGFKYRQTSAMNIEIAGATININGTRTTIADTVLTMVDNSNNYIYVDYRDNSLKSSIYSSDVAYGYMLYNVTTSGASITNITKSNDIFLGMLGYDDSNIVKGADGKIKVGSISTSQVIGLDLYISDNVDVSANTTARHTHDNKIVIDSIEQSDIDKWNTTSNEGSNISLDVTNFDNNLSSADNTVQKAMETLDELVASGGGEVTEVNGGIY